MSGGRCFVWRARNIMHFINNWNTAAWTSSCHAFCLLNRVEPQKQTQTAIEWWPFGFVFDIHLGILSAQAMINILYLIIIRRFFMIDEKKVATDYSWFADKSFGYTRWNLFLRESFWKTLSAIAKKILPIDDEVLDINHSAAALPFVVTFFWSWKGWFPI